MAKQVTEKVPVLCAWLQSAMMFAGKTEAILDERKMPGVQMEWLEGEGLILKAKEMKALIPSTNVKIVTFA